MVAWAGGDAFILLDITLRLRLSCKTQHFESATTRLELVTSAMPSQYHSLLEVPKVCESPANKHDSYLEFSLGLQDIRVGYCMVTCNRLHLAGLETKGRNKAWLYRVGAHRPQPARGLRPSNSA